MPDAPSSKPNSVRPMIQVMRVPGQAACSVRTTGRVWQQSPMADSRMRQRAGVGRAGASAAADRSQAENHHRTASTLPRRIARQDGNGILYEDTLVSHAEPALFEPSSWPGAPVAPGYSGGRGATLFIEHAGQRWVLRHYHRGGTIGRILDDQFLWLGEERTRCFREWRLLAHLQDLGLPAPRPVAARYRRRGLVYTADLMTVLIPDVEPLSTRLTAGAGHCGRTSGPRWAGASATSIARRSFTRT